MADVTLIVLGTLNTLGIGLGVPLLLHYLKERTSNLAREVSERVLADYALQNSKTLAAVEADHQRRLREFSLFTQRQHLVYAKLYRLYREASERYRANVGLTLGPDFYHMTAEIAQRYLNEIRMSGDVADRAIALYQRGKRDEAAELMHEILTAHRFQQAERVFARAKSYEALNELYLSEPAREAAQAARLALASASTMQHHRSVGVPQHEELADQAARHAVDRVAELLAVLREEMRRGLT